MTCTGTSSVVSFLIGIAREGLTRLQYYRGTYVYMCAYARCYYTKIVSLDVSLGYHFGHSNARLFRVNFETFVRVLLLFVITFQSLRGSVYFNERLYVILACLLLVVGIINKKRKQGEI